MSKGQVDQLRKKVDAFLRDALAEHDETARAKLLGKAVYWNDMSAKAGRSPLGSGSRLKQG